MTARHGAARYGAALFATLLILVLAAPFLRLVYCGLAVIYCKLALKPLTSTWVHARNPHDLSLQPGAPVVPKILHQIWLSSSPQPPDRWQEPIVSCQETHSHWQRRLWTIDTSHDFVASNYSWFLPTYDSYPLFVQRVDALKYLLLLTFGGVYLDLDIGCRNALDPLLRFPMVVASTTPVGFATDFIAATPGHPLLQAMVKELPRWNKHYGSTYPTAMFSTGPMFLTLQYMRQPEAARTVAVLPPHLYGGKGSFFAHYDGNSWQGADSAAISWVQQNTALVLGTVALLLGGSLLLVIAMRARRLAARGTKP